MKKDIELNNIEMNNHLTIDNTRIKKMIDIKLDFLSNKISLEEAKKRMSTSFDKITAQEFAMAEQHLQSFGITDDMLAEKLKSPILFKTMASLATIEMISERGGFKISDFIHKLVAEIDRVNNIQ